MTLASVVDETRGNCIAGPFFAASSLKRGLGTSRKQSWRVGKGSVMVTARVFIVSDIVFGELARYRGVVGGIVTGWEH